MGNITSYEVKTIYRDELTGICTLDDKDYINAGDFLHIYNVLLELGFESYSYENKPHFKKYDKNDNYTVFVVFDPYIE